MQRLLRSVKIYFFCDALCGFITLIYRDNKTTIYSKTIFYMDMTCLSKNLIIHVFVK